MKYDMRHYNTFKSSFWDLDLDLGLDFRIYMILVKLRLFI